MLHGRSLKVWLTSALFFCKQKEHGESRAPSSELKNALDIRKLGTTIADLCFATSQMVANKAIEINPTQLG